MVGLGDVFGAVDAGVATLGPPGLAVELAQLRPLRRLGDDEEVPGLDVAARGRLRRRPDDGVQVGVGDGIGLEAANRPHRVNRVAQRHAQSISVAHAILPSVQPTG